MAGSRPRPGKFLARRPADAAIAVLTRMSMVAGRGVTARAVARIAGLTDSDRVVDVGSGPGAAVREAARRVATATGVDPDAASLALARRISAGLRVRNVTWLQGRAEDLPLSDGCATVVWSLRAAHHWADRGAGFAEAHRILRPGGRLLIAERLVRAGARGHAAHGFTMAQVEQVSKEMAAAGFTGIRTQISRARLRALLVIQADRP